MIKTVLLGTGIVAGGTTYIALNNVSEKRLHKIPTPRMYKVKELPIYAPAIDTNNLQTTEENISPLSTLRQGIQSNVSVVREVIWAANDSVVAGKERAEQIWETSKAHTAGLIDTLQNSDALTQSAVIAGAGLLGILLGIRGGKVKKTLYGATLATGTAALLYPTVSRQMYDNVSVTVTENIKGFYNSGSFILKMVPVGSFGQPGDLYYSRHPVYYNTVTQSTIVGTPCPQANHQAWARKATSPEKLTD